MSTPSATRFTRMSTMNRTVNRCVYVAVNYSYLFIRNWIRFWYVGLVVVTAVYIQALNGYGECLSRPKKWLTLQCRQIGATAVRTGVGRLECTDFLIMILKCTWWTWVGGTLCKVSLFIETKISRIRSSPLWRGKVAVQSCQSIYRCGIVRAKRLDRNGRLWSDASYQWW